MTAQAEAAQPTPEAKEQKPPAGDDILIEIDGLTKHYRDLTAVNNASFRIARGEVVGFLGPNGAGKSTTMRMLTGAIPASAGAAKVAGYDVFEDPSEVKRRVGYLPEIPPVYFDLTVEDQLRFGCALKGLRGAEVKRHVERSVERCGLQEHFKRLVGKLSKGFRQRVGLAQALLGDPEVLILDEPTVGLDPTQIQVVRELIAELGGEHTVVLSTHILQEVTMVCQRVIMIRRGEIVLDERIDKLPERFPDKSLEQIFLQMVEQ